MNGEITLKPQHTATILKQPGADMKTKVAGRSHVGVMNGQTYPIEVQRGIVKRCASAERGWLIRRMIRRLKRKGRGVTSDEAEDLVSLEQDAKRYRAETMAEIGASLHPPMHAKTVERYAKRCRRSVDVRRDEIREQLQSGSTGEDKMKELETEDYFLHAMQEQKGERKQKVLYTYIDVNMVDQRETHKRERREQAKLESRSCRHIFEEYPRLLRLVEILHIEPIVWKKKHGPDQGEKTPKDKAGLKDREIDKGLADLITKAGIEGNSTYTADAIAVHLSSVVKLDDDIHKGRSRWLLMTEDDMKKVATVCNGKDIAHARKLLDLTYKRVSKAHLERQEKPRWLTQEHVFMHGYTSTGKGKEGMVNAKLATGNAARSLPRLHDSIPLYGYAKADEVYRATTTQKKHDVVQGKRIANLNERKEQEQLLSGGRFFNDPNLRAEDIVVSDEYSVELSASKNYGWSKSGELAVHTAHEKRLALVTVYASVRYPSVDSDGTPVTDDTQLFDIRICPPLPTQKKGEYPYWQEEHKRFNMTVELARYMYEDGRLHVPGEDPDDNALFDALNTTPVLQYSFKKLRMWDEGDRDEDDEMFIPEQTFKEDVYHGMWLMAKTPDEQDKVFKGSDNRTLDTMEEVFKTYGMDINAFRNFPKPTKQGGEMQKAIEDWYDKQFEVVKKKGKTKPEGLRKALQVTFSIHEGKRNIIGMDEGKRYAQLGVEMQKDENVKDSTKYPYPQLWMLHRLMNIHIRPKFHRVSTNRSERVTVLTPTGEGSSVAVDLDDLDKYFNDSPYIHIKTRRSDQEGGLELMKKDKGNFLSYVKALNEKFTVGKVTLMDRASYHDVPTLDDMYTGKATAIERVLHSQGGVGGRICVDDRDNATVKTRSNTGAVEDKPVYAKTQFDHVKQKRGVVWVGEFEKNNPGVQSSMLKMFRVTKDFLEEGFSDVTKEFFEITQGLKDTERTVDLDDPAIVRLSADLYTMEKAEPKKPTIKRKITISPKAQEEIADISAKQIKENPYMAGITARLKNGAVLWNVPYSPELNPKERMIGFVKNYVRNLFSGTAEDPDTQKRVRVPKSRHNVALAIINAYKQLTPAMVANHILCSGYRTAQETRVSYDQYVASGEDALTFSEYLARDTLTREREATGTACVVVPRTRFDEPEVKRKVAGLSRERISRDEASRYISLTPGSWESDRGLHVQVAKLYFKDVRGLLKHIGAEYETVSEPYQSGNRRVVRLRLVIGYMKSKNFTQAQMTDVVVKFARVKLDPHTTGDGMSDAGRGGDSVLEDTDTIDPRLPLQIVSGVEIKQDIIDDMRRAHVAQMERNRDVQGMFIAKYKRHFDTVVKLMNTQYNDGDVSNFADSVFFALYMHVCLRYMKRFQPYRVREIKDEIKVLYDRLKEGGRGGAVHMKSVLSQHHSSISRYVGIA